MKTLLVMTLLTLLLPNSTLAQEIYKWEDEKGVIHYGDKPAHPTAVPLEKESLPYSTTGAVPPESAAEKKERRRQEREEDRVGNTGRSPRPSPSLSKPKAQLDRNGRLQISGAIRNGGKGLCESPTVEVVIFDEGGSVDGNFETPAFPNGLAWGQEARFEGEYLTPVGDTLSWDAVPRCESEDGAIYGAHKQGTVSLKRSRTVRLKKFKTQ
jgi:hypothetical protein